MSDYYVGGKKLGFWIAAFSSRATGESAWLLLGLTGAGAVAGVNAFWIVIGEIIGVGTAWFLMARPFKKLTDTYDSITVPDFLASHFKTTTHTLRLIAAGSLIVFATIYVSAQIDATGAAFEAFLGWNYFVGALAGFALVMAYIFMGGFVAVAWSDLFQGLLMLFGLVLVPVVGYLAISEPGLTQGLKALDPYLLNFWGPGGLSVENTFAILGFLMIGLGFMGSPQLFVRFMAIRDESEINKGRWVAIAFTLLTDIGAVMIGLIGRYLFDVPTEEVSNVLGNGGQNVLPMLVEHLMPPLLIGLYVAVVLSAIMSTIDSLLVVASSAVTRDYYQQVRGVDHSDARLTRLSRRVTIIMALIALAVAMSVAVISPTHTIFWFVIFGWSGIAATFCPVMILSLFWKGYTEKGAIASMVTGFLCVPLFKFGVSKLPTIGPLFDKLDVMLPAFILAMVAGFWASRSGKSHEARPKP
ncbi:MAG: sodium/proline symporter [Alphaproteobacteria bacterium]|nr:MAG: sodium/proline symporter [Alphaproteobacteria bacterium]